MAGQSKAPKKEKKYNAGTFKPGQSGNISGQNGHTEGWQPYAKRARHWLVTLTGEQLLDISRNKKLLAKYSSYDAIIIRGLVDAMVGINTLAEREALLDRTEGKVKNTVSLVGPDDGPIISATVSPQEASMIYQKLMNGKV